MNLLTLIFWSLLALFGVSWTADTYHSRSGVTASSSSNGVTVSYSPIATYNSPHIPNSLDNLSKLGHAPTFRRTLPYRAPSRTPDVRRLTIKPLPLIDPWSPIFVMQANSKCPRGSRNIIWKRVRFAKLICMRAFTPRKVWMSARYELTGRYPSAWNEQARLYVFIIRHITYTVCSVTENIWEAYFASDTSYMFIIRHVTYAVSCLAENLWEAYFAGDTSSVNSEFHNREPPSSLRQSICNATSCRFRFVGGGKTRMERYVSGDHLIPYAECYVTTTTSTETFRFVSYTAQPSTPTTGGEAFRYIVTRIPVLDLINYINVIELRSLAKLHGLSPRPKMSREDVVKLFEDHQACSTCQSYYAIFERAEIDVRESPPEPVSCTKTQRKTVAQKHRSVAFSYDDAVRYSVNPSFFDMKPPDAFEFLSYVPQGSPMACDNILETRIPLSDLPAFLSKTELQIIAASHGIFTSKKTRASEMKAALETHICYACPEYVTTWKLQWETQTTLPSFPPGTLDVKRTHEIALSWSKEFEAENITESGCTVCGLLHQTRELTPFEPSSFDLDLLKSPFSRKERTTSSDPIQPLDGPLLDDECNMICNKCRSALEAQKMPLNALANGFWIGKIPAELQDLTFAEKLLVARIRHNRCVVRVASGRVKMMANVIMFSNPTPVVYNVLPPPKADLDEVLAFVYTASSMPTPDEVTRTPLLVRRNKVARALDWLKLNHTDYHDLEISQDNLLQYPEYGVPFVMEYHPASGESNREPLTMSLHDDGDDEGTAEGPCPFTVHGLTGTEYSTMSTKAMKAMALRHLQAGGKVLGIGHDGVAESMYDNPQAYPKMFPWLFPYGYGGINQRHLKGKLNSASQKRNLLMYHDKRFQTDVHFPIVAFNHEQMKSSISGSFLAAKRYDFPDIADRLSKLDPNVLVNISGRMLSGEVVKPETDAEKLCFSLLNDIDHVGGHVDGSLSSKKQRRNELWSLMASKGAPMWFITFSPADVKHPLCIYYAGKRLDFQPQIPLGPEERKLLISQNPVAAARFFHFMVQAFIRHILGVHGDIDGLFGKTDAYYGMVEQQGRLTLHLHVLLWIAGSPSPQEIRDRLMKGDEEFQNALIDYLESVHTGDFLTGSKDDVKDRVQHMADNNDATLRLPSLPPPACTQHDDCYTPECQACKDILTWYQDFKLEVDELLLRSNIHTCRASSKVSGSNNAPKGCLTRDGICAARFPRDLFLRTIVDLADGHIDLKKLEPMMNTVAPLITYSMRGNTDCTCLLSGTAIKSVIIYVTDYVVKQTLKSHQIFSTAYDVLNCRELQEDSSDNRLHTARRTLLKIVNALSTKLEIGSPMASMYLLRNPDHYTSHEFVPFYWRSYVKRARRDVHGQHQNLDTSTLPDPDEQDTENVQIGQNDRRFYEKSKVHDYIYRPTTYQNMNLWNWVQGYSIKKRSEKDYSIFKFLLQGAEIDVEVHLTDDELSTVPSRLRSLNAHEKQEMLKKILDNSFTPEHPLFLTHYPSYNSSQLDVTVPNILGGGLPRSDTGDRAFYCSAMLTLFKPWRTGYDLVPATGDWEEAFERYCFTPRQQKLMANFNLRYECLDARDDYSAKRKAAQASKFLLNQNILGHDSDGSDSEFEEEIITQRVKTIDDRVREAFENQSSRYADNIRRRYEIDCMLIRLGLSVDTNYHEAYSSPTFEGGPLFAPEVYKTPSAWKSVVKTARETLLKSLMERTTQHTASLNGMPMYSANQPIEQIRLLDKNYFLKDYQARTRQAQEITDHVAQTENLNAEQGRAFRLIANHASSLAPPQLKMYIGGMAGTGKSRVVHAVKKFFQLRKEDGRYVVIAPTGTAAAQLHGSTYHSLLGIGTDEDSESVRKDDQTALRAAQERLKGVEYVIFDEISMVPCHDLYKISARFCEIKNNPDEIFGGLNIIVLGDFAQLSPVHGMSLYNGEAMVLDARSNLTRQEGFLGRAIWHQFTTVVMLVQNMRQLHQSARDAQFRTCLTNMRYAACTDDDIKFLNSLVVETNLEDKPLDPALRNVAVITRYNAQRDRFNEIGVERFARETGQKLHEFFSEDALAVQEDNQTKKRKRGKRVKLCSFSPETQERLWSLPPSSNSKHIPGKLLICRGMPVVIRNNDATELCITKGQPATVVGWDSRTLASGKEALSTLFVKLTDPPKNVHFDGLPENVVPLPTQLTSRLFVQTPSGENIAIKRWQVPVLPFFAMTDYTSQGKTRPWNLVHILHSPHHQAVYTALSRGSTADGTAILYGYDETKIRKGITGWLRQEFRELEVLNKMTEYRYLKLIPEDSITDLRSSTLMNYNCLKKEYPDLQLKLHRALNTNPNEDIVFKETAPILRDPKINKAAIAERVKASKKPGTAKVQGKTEIPAKKKIRKAPRVSSNSDNTLIIGPTWDEHHYTCGYDSLVFLLGNMYREASPTSRSEWSTMSPLMKSLAISFDHDASDPDSTRDMLRRTLHDMDPIAFPDGEKGIDIEELAIALAGQNEEEASSYLTCKACKSIEVSSFFELTGVVYPMAPSHIVSKSIKDQLVARYTAACVCTVCHDTHGISNILQHGEFAQNFPPVVFVPLIYEDLHADYRIPLTLHGIQYKMKGLVYYGGFHFTAIFADIKDRLWFHDGMRGRTARQVLGGAEGNNFPALHDGKRQALAVYAKE